MNNVYLKKIVNQEKLNTKIQLVQEHLDLAREELIQLHKNKLLSEEIDRDPKIWTGAEAKVQEFLKKLPSSIEHQNGQNPVSYKVVVNVGKKDGKVQQNRFTFYESGRVYDYNLMRSLGYVLDGDKIIITSKDPSAIISMSDNIKLAIIDSKGNLIRLKTPESESMFDKPKENALLDNLQMVLDYAGFIPYFGDALDAINATIYFLRGKPFEGFLSLIAIIPVVGSVIALAVKSAFRTAKTAIKGTKTFTKLQATKLIEKWWVKGDIRGIKDLTKMLVASGKISTKQMDIIASSFRGFGKKLETAGDSVKGINSRVSKYLDDAGEKCKNGGKGIDDAVDDILKSQKKSADVAAAAAEKASKSFLRVPKKILNKLTFDLLPKIKAQSWWPAEKLAKLGKVTERRFIEQAVSRPDRLGYLMKLGGKTQRQMTSKELNSKLIKLGNKEKDEILDIFIKNPNLEKYMSTKRITGGIDFDKMFRSADDTTEFMTKLGKISNKEVNKNFSETIAKQSVGNNNILWNTYKDDLGNKIISSQLSREIKVNFAKNVDWFWNEFQQMQETFGFESSEHIKNYGVVPLSKWALSTSSPGTYASMQKSRDAILPFLHAAKKSANVANAAVNAFGIQLTDLEEYPPLGSDAATFKKT
mgnify:CR=1 FL=1